LDENQRRLIIIIIIIIIIISTNFPWVDEPFTPWRHDAEWRSGNAEIAIFAPSAFDDFTGQSG